MAGPTITTPTPKPLRSVNIKLDGLTESQVEEIKEMIRGWVEKNDLTSVCEKLTGGQPDETQPKIYL